MGNTMTLTKRFLWNARGEDLCGAVPRQNAREEGEAENVNNSSENFFCKEEK